MSSDWKVSGLEHRDFQHSHDGPEVAKPRARKNTRKWCKGKVGVEHVLTMSHSHWKNFRFCLNVCQNCGKEIYTSCK
jgi:hypothetical protein